MLKILAKLIFLILLFSLFGCERESATDRGKIYLKILIPEEKKNVVKQISVVVKPYILQEDKEVLEIIRQVVNFGETAELKFVSEKKFVPENVFFASAPITTSDNNFQNSCSFYTQRCGTILSVCDSLSCDDYMSFNINFAEESKEGITMQINQQEFLVLQKELILDLPVYEDAKPYSVDIFISDDAGSFKVWRRNFYVVSPGQVVFIKIDGLDLSLLYKDADGDGIGGEPIVSYESNIGEGITTVGGDLDDSNPYILTLDDTILFEDKDRDFYPSGNTKSIKEFYKGTKNTSFYKRLRDIIFLLKQDSNSSSGRTSIRDILEEAQKNGFYTADKLKSTTELDCDDNDPTVYPGAPINCDDSKDNNCDGIIEFWAYTDQDGDKYAPNSVSICLLRFYPGFITVGSEIAIGDIDDRDPSVNIPVGVGACDGQDKMWAYIDKDGDKYSPLSVSFCVEVTSSGYTSASEILGFSDCDDSNAGVYPEAVPNCNDSQDNNCDGSVEIWGYVDQDKDRYKYAGSVSVCVEFAGSTTYTPVNLILPGDDCDDNNASIYPGAVLNCSDSVDNDCDGNVEKWAYTDSDGDRYAPNSSSSCVNVVSFPGYITAGSELGTNDCNDSNPSINPSASDDFCNAVDDNCNGYVDENTSPCYVPSLEVFSWGLSYVVLKWFYPNPSSNVENFIVEKSDDNAVFTPIASLPSFVTSYTDYTYISSAKYYRVYAKNATGAGGKSNVVSVGTSPPLPFAKVITAPGNEIVFTGALLPVDLSSNFYGGYLLAGVTSTSSGNDDILLLKLTKRGDLEWARAIGRDRSEKIHSSIVNSNASFVAVGETYSSGLTCGGNCSDVLVLSSSKPYTSYSLRTFGGEWTDTAYSVLEVSGGNLLIVGETYSFGNTCGGTCTDGYILVLNSSLVLVSSRTIGGGGNDSLKSVVFSQDGGYVFAGKTNSFGSGGFDFFVVKVKSDFSSVEWARTVGGSNDDYADALVKGDDGSFIVVGTTFSFGLTCGNGSCSDIFAVKISNSGVVEWAKTFGGNLTDSAKYIVKTQDGNFIIVGETQSFSSSKDIYVIKISGSGDLLWSKTIGRGGDDFANFAMRGVDGGILILGSTSSFSSGYDIYLVEIREDGLLGCSDNFQNSNTSSPSFSSSSPPVSLVASSSSSAVFSPSLNSIIMNSSVYALCSPSDSFFRAIGSSGDDFFYSAVRASDGGFILTGYTPGAGGSDAYIVKLDNLGNISWQKTIDFSSGSERGRTIFQANDGEFLLGFERGTTSFITKFSSSSISWSKAITTSLSGIKVRGIAQTSDGGYMLAGRLEWSGGSGYNILVMKLNSSGDMAWAKIVTGGPSVQQDTAFSIKRTSDGKYVIANIVNSFRYGTGGGEGFILKLDESGNIDWYRVLGAYTSDDGIVRVLEVEDGNLIGVGYMRSTFSLGGTYDMWIVKLDKNGNIIWSKIVGWAGSHDFASDITMPSDGNYLISGVSQGASSDYNSSIVLKMNPNGDILWLRKVFRTYSSAVGFEENSVFESEDGDFILIGTTSSFGNGGKDIYLVKGKDICSSYISDDFGVSNGGSSIYASATMLDVSSLVFVSSVALTMGSGSGNIVEGCSDLLAPSYTSDMQRSDRYKRDTGVGDNVRANYGCSTSKPLFSLIAMLFVFVFFYLLMRRKLAGFPRKIFFILIFIFGILGPAGAQDREKDMIFKDDFFLRGLYQLSHAQGLFLGYFGFAQVSGAPSNYFPSITLGNIQTTGVRWGFSSRFGIVGWEFLSFVILPSISVDFAGQSYILRRKTAFGEGEIQYHFISPSFNANLYSLKKMEDAYFFVFLSPYFSLFVLQPSLKFASGLVRDLFFGKIGFLGGFDLGVSWATLGKLSRRQTRIFGGLGFQIKQSLSLDSFLEYNFAGGLANFIPTLKLKISDGFFFDFFSSLSLNYLFGSQKEFPVFLGFGVSATPWRASYYPIVKTISGVIVDENGNPVKGVVVETDFGNRSISDEKGRFEISVPSDARAIRILVRGKDEKQEESFTFYSPFDNLKIVLEQSKRIETEEKEMKEKESSGEKESSDEENQEENFQEEKEPNE